MKVLPRFRRALKKKNNKNVITLTLYDNEWCFDSQINRKLIAWSTSCHMCVCNRILNKNIRCCEKVVNNYVCIHRLIGIENVCGMLFIMDDLVVIYWI